MFAVIFGLAAIASAFINYKARPIEGYADFYWMPSNNPRGITIPLLPVRVTTFASTIVFFFLFLIAAWSVLI